MRGILQRKVAHSVYARKNNDGAYENFEISGVRSQKKLTCDGAALVSF